jgi:peptidoglycan/LPS O-acetylase OafA/YrhL
MTEPDDATTGSPDPAPALSRAEVARPSATGTSRISALDGLRAVALLIIMGYHFGVGWLQGGFFSLDIFYVLSGYLITGLLLSEFAKRGRIKLSAFWLRRARRLLPALLIVLVVVTLMVRFAEPAGLYPGFRMNALSALFYFSNWWQIHASGNYFVATGAPSPLTHTWSLAVEEQFYLVWPLVVFAVLALAGRSSGGSGPSWSSRGSGPSARPPRWPSSTARGPTPPGSTSAPTPTPSPSWSGPPWPVP